MKRFVIYTKGRTGSTAIKEELNSHPKIVCHGEIFRPIALDSERLQKALKEHGFNYVKLGGTHDSVVPYNVHQSSFIGDIDENDVSRENYKQKISDYFDYLADDASEQGGSAVGAKLIGAKIDRNELFRVFKDLDISVLFLTRQNALRQIISAKVASAVGVYNKVGYKPEDGRQYEFDVADIEVQMRRTIRGANQTAKLLEDNEVQFMNIVYEDWVNDRNRFLENVCNFLDVDNAQMESSPFSVMTPEPLEQLLVN